MEIWWKITESCYFSQLKCAKQHTNRLNFLVPVFFKTIRSFSSTFQGKFPIFKADWKIKHFSRQHSNSSTFQGLWEPWTCIIVKHHSWRQLHKNISVELEIQWKFVSFYSLILTRKDWYQANTHYVTTHYYLRRISFTQPLQIFMEIGILLK